MTLGPAWIALAISAVLVRYGRKVASSADSAALRLHREREKLQEERRRKREQLEWQRTAPERERAAKLEAERRERESARQHEAQQQRADARADCEMLYQLYAVDISERFPRQALDEWIAKYMGDDQSAGNVHRRAEQLRKIIIHHREQVKPTPKFSDLTQLANWTSQQEEEIKSLPIDGRLQRMLLANLKVKNAELATQILENSG